jgi:DNA-binding XRE family transcriptional regulator
MSAHTRKHPTKSPASLKKEIKAKLSRVTDMEDLITLNKVIDKYLPDEERSLTPAEAFGKRWTNPLIRVGIQIQGLRYRDGITQAELAKKLGGVKQSNLSAWENGREKVPEMRLKQLAKIFKTKTLTYDD